MITIENTYVSGFEAAIRGMRNPMNSWDKSDSALGCENKHCKNCTFNIQQCGIAPIFVIGQNDLELMHKLVESGSDHSKFMRMITVTCDITAPLYWWKEFDTYKVGTVRNSCSTMNKIHAKEFTLDDFSHECLNVCGIDCMWCIIHYLNAYRLHYLETKDKQWWWNMIQLLPSSYNQRSTVMLNYAVLRNMYHARKKHKLDEWHDFCGWVENLPYAELITGGAA